MNSYRYGALHVVEAAADSDVIQRALKQIDPRLFLERQVTLDGEAVWCVLCSLDGDQPPVVVFEWRDPEGRPIPHLSSGIVDRMAQMERDPHVLAARVRAKNEEFARKRSERLTEELRGRAEEIRRSGKILLPRSPGLVAARRRQREQGHRV